MGKELDPLDFGYNIPDESLATFTAWPRYVVSVCCL
jgi:hypothetical protein